MPDHLLVVAPDPDSEDPAAALRTEAAARLAALPATGLPLAVALLRALATYGPPGPEQ